MEGTLYWNKGLFKGRTKCEAIIEPDCNELLLFDGPLYESPPVLALVLKSLDDEPPIRTSVFQSNGVDPRADPAKEETKTSTVDEEFFQL